MVTKLLHWVWAKCILENELTRDVYFSSDWVRDGYADCKLRSPTFVECGHSLFQGILSTVDLKRLAGRAPMEEHTYMLTQDAS